MQVQDRSTIVLFGGSFNPVHVGHVAFVECLLAQPHVAAVLVIPSQLNPFKRDEVQLPAALRYAMLQRALAPLPGAAVLDLELRRPPPSYTVETLYAVRSMLPQRPLALAMGQDVYRTFGSWHCAGAIVDAAELIVVDRAGAAPEGPAGARRGVHGLPPAWRDRVRPQGSTALVGPDGRRVVTFVHAELPRVAASQLLAQRDASRVPAAARPLLESHWADEAAHV